MGAGLGIRTSGLVHIYRSEGHDVAALSGVDLHVQPGELVGLLGPSGSGKSTLLALIGGLFKPSAGKVFVGEQELSTLSAAELDTYHASTTSLMLQGARRNLIPYLTPIQNVEFAQGAARRIGVKDLPEPTDVLERVGILDIADAPLRTLPGGKLQLTAIATATAVAPSVLLADEPTSQLDLASRERILEVLSDLSDDGTTVVLVTHDPEVADQLPRTVTIRDGRIGGEGRSGEEYAVITADGFLPLPAHARDELPPGTLVRIEQRGVEFRLIPQDPTGGDLAPRGVDPDGDGDDPAYRPRHGGQT